MRLVRVATALAATALVACGGRSPPGPTPASRGPAATQSADAGPSITTDDVPSVDALARRGVAEAPTMREVARAPEVKAPIELQAGDTDTCYRAIVASNEPVTAWFEAEDHDRRGAASAGNQSLVPPAGPVCFRKGSRLRLVVERPNPSTTARVVVWASP